jgi:DNA-directed RNA polymerase specialized sigma24 family protein
MCASFKPAVGIVLSADEAPDTDARFQRLYRDEYKATVRLARFLTSSADAADDLAQEAFVRLYRHGDRADRPVALLRTITVNVCRSWHTSRRRAEIRLVRHGLPPVSLPPFERELDDSLWKLPYDQRAVIVLRYWLAMSETDIAIALGCRPGTVKSRHARALHVLRKELSS